MSDDVTGAAPNCERCLTPMLMLGATDQPFWRCPSCLLVKIS
jgi:hypothetical protein